MNLQDDLLEYYRRELAYLRVQAGDFAARYPKVAQRLDLSDAESPDPHTERLIESVAFLTARIHRDLDRQFPAVATSLLENLCPSLTQPVAAMTVVQMTLDPSEGKVTAGLRVPRGTALTTTAGTGQTCRMRTAWDLTLWPLRVAGVRLEDPRTLRVDLRCDEGLQANELELDVLRLHLGGDLLTTMPLHELLVTGLEQVQVQADDGTCVRLAADSLAEVGFDEGQEVLTQPAHAHPAYGLLQEYFAFPRKFQFFDVRGLRGCLGAGKGFALRLVFNRSARVLSLLSPEHFVLGCVPAVNLFEQTSEPVVIDHRQHEYLLIPDLQRDAVTEVHSVQAVIASDPQADRPNEIPSVYAEPALQGAEGADLFWTLRRETSLRRDIAGTDVFIGFVDRRDARAVPETPVVYARLLCTNRRLAEQLAPGTRFFGQGVSTATRIRAVYAPSAPRDPALGSQALWAMVSLLRLNHRSLVDGTDGVHTLRQMLMLFAGDSARDQAQVRGIRALHADLATARMGGAPWGGYCRGTDITLDIEPEAFVGNSPLVLASVLSRFFALYTTANSFVRLTLRQGGETVKRWPAMSGRQCLI
jgi:type VI secretion system protein ImpG